MGSIFVRSYFPQGYSEWMSVMQFSNEMDCTIPVSQELYDQYVTNLDSRQIITTIMERHIKEENDIVTNIDYFLNSHPNKNDIAPNRLTMMFL
jgi:hypothetical protein